MSAEGAKGPTAAVPRRASPVDKAMGYDMPAVDASATKTDKIPNFLSKQFRINKSVVIPPAISSVKPEDELMDLKQKLTLMEGDRRAYFETAQWTIKLNSERIAALREENKDIRTRLKKVQTGSSDSISDGARRSAGDRLEASTIHHRKKLDQVHTANEDKEAELARLRSEWAEIENAVDLSEEPTDVQQLRVIENRLEKALLKSEEATTITVTYKKILHALQEERLAYDQRISAIESQLRQKQREYDELKAMAEDALLARDVMKTELQKAEQGFYEEKKSREKELKDKQEVVRKKLEMRDKSDKKKTPMVDMMEQDGGVDAAKQPIDAEQVRASEEDRDGRLVQYEEAFRKIKGAAGVFDINDVVQKFQAQKETQNHLEELKATYEQEIQRLTELKAKTQTEYEELKFSRASHISQRLVDEFEQRLEDAARKYDARHGEFNRATNILTQAKTGIQHIGDKLSNYMTENNRRLPPMADETVVDILSACDGKLTKLIASLDQFGFEKDKVDLPREFPLPKNNIRIKLPQKDNIEEVLLSTAAVDFDEEESGDDDLLDREGMKKQANSLVEQKRKKKKSKGRKKI
eukprot:Opistho-2@47682